MSKRALERLVELGSRSGTPSGNKQNTRAFRKHYAKAKRIPVFILFKAKKPT